MPRCYADAAGRPACAVTRPTLALRAATRDLRPAGPANYELADDAARSHFGRAAASAVAARVCVEHRDEQKVASITRVVEQADLLPTSIADVIALRRHLAEQGARPYDAHQLLFHDPVGFGLPGRVEAAVPYSGSCDPVGEIVLRVEPATRLVAIGVTAAELAYPALLRFYDALSRAAEELGGPVGPPRELYERPWSTAPGAIVATIATPIATPAPDTPSRRSRCRRAASGTGT